MSDIAKRLREDYADYDSRGSINPSAWNRSVEERAEAAAEIERLRALALEYGKHKGMCADHGGRDCNCGWEKARRELAEGK